MQNEFRIQLQEAGLDKPVHVDRPYAQKTGRNHKIKTDTGIEITIPMEEYRNPDHVEFITNMDGTISVLIKNIGVLSSR